MTLSTNPLADVDPGWKRWNDLGIMLEQFYDYRRKTNLHLATLAYHELEKTKRRDDKLYELQLQVQQQAREIDRLTRRLDRASMLFKELKDGQATP